MSAVPGADGGATDRADGRAAVEVQPRQTVTPGWRLSELALAAIILVATVAITWFRVPGSHRDRVWAEDANIFLAQAISEGPWRVLFEGYAGYQHLVPRIVVAGIYPFFDLGDYPRIVYAICAVITGAVAVAVFALSRDLVPFLPARVALGLITALIPLATQETVGNLADLHTYAMWLAPWLLMYRPRTWASSVGWAVVAFLTVMTEIQAVFFVFLIAFGLRRASRRAWPIFASFLVGSVIQGATALVVERTPGSGPLSVPSTVLGWLINTVMPLVSADPETVRRWVTESGMTVALLILVPIIASTVVSMVFGSARQRLLVISLLLGSAAVYTGSAWANSGFWFDYANEPLADLGIRLAINIRYGVAAGMMLAAVLPIAAAVIRSRRPHNAGALVVAGGMSLVTVAVLAYGCTTAISARGYVDQWSTAVDEAVRTCSTLTGATEITLPVAPDRSVPVACSDVLALIR